MTAPAASALGWLDGSPATIPEVLAVPDLGPIAWQALLRDGVTRRVWGEVAIPADRAETPAVRGAATRPLVPPRAVVGRAAAAWVHAGGPAPDRIDVLVRPSGRRPDPHPQRCPHECVLPADDVVGVGPVRVTTVERTAVDIARWLPAPAAVPLLERLARDAGLRPGHALGLLDALAGHRGRRAARTTLRQLHEDLEPGPHPRPAEPTRARTAAARLSPASPGSRRAPRRPATP
ncbi:hypothetical protein [Pengzhenrongella sicca]|uniref:AbiEi antitoxin C-terminal domain-containing protein n=1 Tax=Pengzhenrongella sicca TaxID=2819238 RepID=A0A8A4Z983_9MICO|nr:hypothetical protein [Pengzhenrongella sicca]QTE28035.1 hypothetical protein J4E96_11545 [Pengzhenrongella sicca]